MIELSTFREEDFDKLISWVDNDRLLTQIAGNYFTYPLNREQLKSYLLDAKSIAFNVVTVPEHKVIGHAEIILAGDKLCKIDKLIIGGTSLRGKGIGGMVIKELIKYCTDKLHADEVELNVYDWNIGGLKCYEKAGFIDTGKRLFTQSGSETWTAINMKRKLNTRI